MANFKKIEKITPIEVLGWKRGEYTEPIGLKVPQVYFEKVQKSWQLYENNIFAGFFIDRIIDYANSGFEWYIPSTDINIINTETEIFNKWAEEVNQGISDIIPGLDEVLNWIFQHLMLDGMAVIEWEDGKIKVNNKEYIVPKYIVVHPSTKVDISREGDANEKSFRKVRIKVNGVEKSKNIFVCKSRWTTGSALMEDNYPIPFLTKRFKALTLLDKLIEMDFNTCQEVHDEFVGLYVGDKDHELEPDIIEQKTGKLLKPGTLREYADILKPKISSEGGESSGKWVRVLPWYTKLAIERVDVSTLINMDKYIPVVNFLLMSFGIMVEFRGGRTDFENTNTKNFEEMLNSPRRQVKRTLEGVLCRKIVMDNKLQVIPNLAWNPLNIVGSELLNTFFKLLEIGRLSTDTYWRKAGVDPEYELAKLKVQDNETFNVSVPISFKQSVAKEKKEEKEEK